VAAALARVDGMFAFAVWDRKDRLLWLARDRFGEKPLYYSLQTGTVIFGSELRAFNHSKRFQPKLAKESIPLYLAHGCFPDTSCVWADMLRLRPGHYACVDLSQLASGQLTDVSDIPTRPYWDPVEAYSRARAAPYRGSFEDAVGDLERKLRKVVKTRMVSDVPLGAFLSGGIDSSLLVAIMAMEGAKVDTFTIGYDDKAYDEAVFARRVAQHIGTNHHEIRVDVADALSVAHKIGTIYDEPFADQSQIPSYLVSAAARGHVTVALTGDGADEIFGGYNRHVWLPRVWRYLDRVPMLYRSALGAPLNWLSQENWNWIGRTAEATGLKWLAHAGLGLKMQKLNRCLTAASEEELYRSISEMWQNPSGLMNDGETFAAQAALPSIHGGSTDRVIFWDTISYLPNDILTKVDRASMAVSLETRAPYLDHRLAEWSWSLPTEYKVEATQGKKIMRHLLARHVPAGLFERPKQGFGIPIDGWLRGPLRSWGESLLDPARIRAEGLFNEKLIQVAWSQHQSGRVDRSSELWCILVFQCWLEQMHGSDTQPDNLKYWN